MKKKIYMKPENATSMIQMEQWMQDWEEELTEQDKLRIAAEIEESKKHTCYWCGGQCGGHLTYRRVYSEDGSLFVQGWISSECCQLAHWAIEAADGDKS
jgi:hypothetical protein